MSTTCCGYNVNISHGLDERAHDRYNANAVLNIVIYKSAISNHRCLQEHTQCSHSTCTLTCVRDCIKFSGPDGREWKTPGSYFTELRSERNSSFSPGEWDGGGSLSTWYFFPWFIYTRETWLQFLFSYAIPCTSVPWQSNGNIASAPRARRLHVFTDDDWPDQRRKTMLWWCYTELVTRLTVRPVVDLGFCLGGGAERINIWKKI